MSFSDLCLSLTIAQDKKSEEEYIKRGTFKSVSDTVQCDARLSSPFRLRASVEVLPLLLKMKYRAAF
jgi:hypothetical protein